MVVQWAWPRERAARQTLRARPPPFLKIRGAYQAFPPTQKSRPIWTASPAAVEDTTDLFGPNSSYHCQRIRPATRILLACGVSATSAKAHCSGVLCSLPLRRENQAPNRPPATIVLVSWVRWRCSVEDGQSGAGRLPLWSSSSGPARCLLFQERLHGLENGLDVLDRVACQR